MAKKKKAKDLTNEIAIDGVSPEGTAVAEKKPLTPYEKEEQYLKSLDAKQKKEYLRSKRAVRRSEWLSEYWFIIILGVVAFIALAIVSIITTFRLWEDKEDEIPEEETPIVTESVEIGDFDF